jgi:hypothetical protein
LWEASALSFIEVEVESDSAVAVLWVSEAAASSGVPVFVLSAFFRWGAEAFAGLVVEVEAIVASTGVNANASAALVVKSVGDAIDSWAVNWFA